MRSVFLISCLLTSLAWSNSIDSFKSPHMKFGHNLSSTLRNTNSFEPNGVLARPTYELTHNWLEPFLSEVDSPVISSSHLGWKSAFIISPYAGELNTQLNFRFSKFFELGLGYSNRFYFGSQVYLEDDNFQNEQLKARWNNSYIQNNLYKDNEFINLQAFNSMCRFIVFPTTQFYGLEIIFNHQMIDVNSSNQGRLYDFKSTLPILPRDDIGELKISQYFLVSEGHHYFIDLQYQATHFKEKFFKDLNLFPRLSSGSLSQITTELGGIWPLKSDLFLGGSFSHRFNSTDSNFGLDQIFMTMNLEYFLNFN